MKCVVILQNRTTKIVPASWVQNKNRKKNTNIFISPDENKVPDFSLPIKYFNQSVDACYYGFCLGKYSKFEVMICFIFCMIFTYNLFFIQRRRCCCCTGCNQEKKTISCQLYNKQKTQNQQESFRVRGSD